MFSNDRKTVGVFLEKASGEFQKVLCEGITKTAQQLGYNVAVFNAFGKYGDNERHFSGDQMIYDLAPWEELDGVILALDTMDDPSSKGKITHKVKQYCHCPVVSVREMIDGVNNLLVKNTTCMEGMVKHFIEDHGFTKLCFMTGPQSHWDAVERLQCFENVMESYGLAVGEHQKFYGDYWFNMGKEACDWFLIGQEQPEAILCANDNMAQAVASELIGRGYHIPEDICVSGYDGLIDCVGFSPTLSTMEVPFFDMGIKAMKVIYEKQETPEDIEDIYFQAQTVLRESCGCMKHSGKDVLMKKRTIFEEEKTAHNREVQLDYLSISLGDSDNIQQVAKWLAYYQYNIEGLSNYAVCFCENVFKEEKITEYTDRMVMRIAFKERVDLGELEVTFNRKELIPELLSDEKPQCWYFATLHFQDNCYGYEAFNFSKPEQMGNLYFRWNINIGNKIHDMLVEYKMQSLILELEEMYDKDALTGMYNRRGWENKGKILFSRAKKEDKTIFLAVIDLDGMKQINDNYGHHEGDFALKKVTEAIEAVSGGQQISARTGGDEFVVMAKGITEEEGKAFLHRFEQYLETFNEAGEKTYEIHASCGYVCRVPKEEETIETYTKESDGVMYQNKVINKVRRGEMLR